MANTNDAASDPDRMPHENVAHWRVHTENAEGQWQAVMGTNTVSDTSDNDAVLATAYVFTSPIDGSIVVQINTNSFRDVPVRVNINNNDVFNGTLTPNRPKEPPR